MCVCVCECVYFVNFNEFRKCKIFFKKVYPILKVYVSIDKKNEE